MKDMGNVESALQRLSTKPRLPSLAAKHKDDVDKPLKYPPIDAHPEGERKAARHLGEKFNTEVRVMDTTSIATSVRRLRNYRVRVDRKYLDSLTIAERARLEALLKEVELKHELFYQAISAKTESLNGGAANVTAKPN